MCTPAGLLQVPADSNFGAYKNFRAYKGEAKLEKIAATTKEKNMQYQAENGPSPRANPTQAHIEWTPRNNANQKLAFKRIHTNGIANKTFHCEHCKLQA